MSTTEELDIRIDELQKYPLNWALNRRDGKWEQMLRSRLDELKTARNELAGPDSKQLKMYVWHDVLRDYTPGMVCILAHNYEEAIKTAREQLPDYVTDDFAGGEHKVYDKPQAEYVYGGG